MQTEKQRERLVDLIKNADNDKNLCWYDLYDLCDKKGGCAEYFADYLIANNVVVLPCKVGDTVWCLTEYPKKDVFECRVSSIEMGRSSNAIIIDRVVGKFTLQRCRGYYFDDFGEIVFLEKAEAEAKLREMRDGT